MHQIIAQLVKGLKVGTAVSNEDEPTGDYTVDEKSRQVMLTEQGHQHIEEIFVQAGLLKSGESLYDLSHIVLPHHVNAALRAKSLFHKNVDYLVKNRKVLIVDEFTGRAMPGRRWSDGLHQAIEAKEGVEVQGENQTLASITFQNYFRYYDKLAGMTGTADTEAYEFQEIYGLEVALIPTHKPMIRDDLSDLVYLNVEQKYVAIIDDIKASVDQGRPVLVGTTSIEASEQLSKLLRQEKLEHQVLNAKHHESESKIITQAGQSRAVTIATNMAGRGTDIVLGGKVDDGVLTESDRIEWEKSHREVVEAGGLHIIGTERHESRRIDNQLRGRSGRQGDPGSTRFYLSLEDNLMRIFAGEKMRAIMSKVGLEEDEAIEHPWVTRAIENAQRKVEAHNFDMRKTLLEYDDTANEQRREFYAYRKDVVAADSVREDVEESVDIVLEQVVNQHIALGASEDLWRLDDMQKVLKDEFGLEAPCAQWIKDEPQLERSDIIERILKLGHSALDMPPPQLSVATTAETMDDETMVETMEWDLIDKMLILQIIDHHWREHLSAMDYLRQGIGLRSFGQRNPKQEYKREAFAMFKTMMSQVNGNVARHVLLLRANKEHIPKMEQAAEQGVRQGVRQGTRRVPRQETKPNQSPQRDRSPTLAPPRSLLSPTHGVIATTGQDNAKLKRNDPCFCGSGKKYKKCHGRGRH